MRKVSVHCSGLAVVAAGAGLLAESDTSQKLTLIMSANQDPAGHLTNNSSRPKFATLNKVPGFSSLNRLRTVQQLTFDRNLEAHERDTHA